MIKPCPSYPDYFADELGNIYSTKGKNQFSNSITPKLIKGFFNKKEQRWFVTTIINGKESNPCKSILVLDAFISPRPCGMFACHGVLGRTVDTLENLSWQTPMQNTKDRYRDNTILYGERNPLAKLNELQVRVIRRAYEKHFITFRYLAKIFHVDQSLIEHIVKRKTWTHI